MTEKHGEGDSEGEGGRQGGIFPPRGEMTEGKSPTRPQPSNTCSTSKSISSYKGKFILRVICTHLQMFPPGKYKGKDSVGKNFSPLLAIELRFCNYKAESLLQ